MKRFFALFSVFALLVCMAMPTAASASVTAFDNDVGFSQGFVIAPNFTQEFSPIVIHAVENGTDLKADTALQRGLDGCLAKGIVPPFKFWEGQNTKASRCNAALISQNTTIFPHRFGKDIRRLSCKDKA